MKKLTQDYVEGLREDLKAPQEAAAYLNAASEEASENVFLLALQDVMEAKGVENQVVTAESQHENGVEIFSNPLIES